MGLATAGVGLVPSAAAIGMAGAGDHHSRCAIAQGLALGGEYGGAAVYVAEHCAAGHKSGFFTSFIQASVAGGFILSLIVVLTTKAVARATGTWAEWAWRFPFVFSLLLLAVSLWMRLKLSESPVFRAIKEAGETAEEPVHRKLHLSRQHQADSGRAVRDRRRVDRDLVHRDLQRARRSCETMRVADTAAQLIVGA